MFLPFCRSSSSSSSKSNLHKLFMKFQACKFSSSYSPSQADSRSVKVSVWWDVDNCGVPSGVSYKKVASSIMAAVRANGIKGDINIQAYSAYGNSNLHNGEGYALELTGIDLERINEHNYTDGKTAAYEELLRDLQDWVYKNPPPAHLFLIFGDVHFSGILHRLRMCNYNILLACPGRPHVALYHAATIVWQWSSLLKGEDLTGRHFNYPPDALFNSWYGNSNVPLENPFSVVEQLTSSQNVEIYKPSLNLKLGEASKSLSRQVIKMLSLHPHGISIGDLRAKLTKCDRPFSKRFYRYQNFSEFLESIPHVHIQYLGEGNFWVCLGPSTTSAVKNKQKDRATQKLHNEGKNVEVGKPDDVTAYQFCTRWGESNSLEEWEQHASDWENMRVSVWWDFNSCGVPSDINFLNVAPSIMGVLRANRIKGPIHIDAYGDVSQLSEIEQEALYLSGIDLHHIPGGKNISHKRLMDWASQNPPPAHLFLIYDDDDYRDRDFDRTILLLYRRYNILLALPIKHGYGVATIVWQWSSMLKGKYFTGIYYDIPPHWYIKGCVPREYPSEWYRNSNVPIDNPFLRSTPYLIPSMTSVVKNEQKGVDRSGMHVLFSIESFWDDVESFVFTSRGSRLVSRSRSREDMALKLQRHGPLFLMSLTTEDILQLVELLIAEKKWLQESPLTAFPFKLTQSLPKSSLMGQSHSVIGV